MKFQFKNLFGKAPKADDALAQPLAVAQLLIEIARADLSINTAEMSVIRSHLKQAYALEDTQLDAVVAKASTHAEQAVSLYDTVQIVNKNLTADDKRQLMHSLWQVAYADQRLDAHEEALLRRLADLLYVSHEVFIREKLRLLDSVAPV